MDHHHAPSPHPRRDHGGGLDAAIRGFGGARGDWIDLFRLYTVEDAAAWQDRLARAHIWTRIFPYCRHFLRLGLPSGDGWNRLDRAL